MNVKYCISFDLSKQMTRNRDGQVCKFSYQNFLPVNLLTIVPALQVTVFTLFYAKL